MRIAIVALVLVAAVLPSAPAAAQAGGTVYRGTTDQGKRVAVNVGPDQRVRRVSIAWTATCRRARLADDTVIVPRSATSLTFRASGAYTVRQKGGYRIRVSLTIRGQRETAATAGQRWDGTIAGRATVRRRGKVVDRCRLRSTVWSATLPQKPPPFTPPGSTPPTTTTPSSSPPPPPAPAGEPRTIKVGAWAFEMTGDAGDYITGGRRWVHGPPGDTLNASGGGAVAHFRIDSPDGWWNVDFAAPQGQQLTAGTRYTGATRYPFQDAGAGLSVSGMGRGCNELTGEFTVHELAYDARGVMTRFKASFVQHCEGGSTSARGTIEFSAP